MKFAWLGCLVGGSLLIAGSPQTDINVNSRYTVESVELSGANQAKISKGLRKDIARLTGEKLNPSNLDDLARRIRKELHVRSVSHRLVRGDTPQTVKVVFDVKGQPRSFEVSIPKFLYHAKQGWSAAVEGTGEFGPHHLTAGIVSDGDELVERFAGITGRYENTHVGSDRVRFRFVAESFHEQWNRTTRLALAPDAAEAAQTSPIYRARQNFEPTVTVALAGPLTLSVGAGFQSLDPDYPAASTESANAVITTLRYHRRMEDSGPGQRELDAGYGLRAATRLLGSDFVYARHRLSVRYAWTAGRHTVLDEAMAGWITGRAPLFERFVLGTSSTLRGWNK
ncbi:MAG: hypothetical protein M1436_05670, partial [Acidobacteria bacterium]|nr:hypothetical protein [Acidobacteriota bacterium]